MIYNDPYRTDRDAPDGGESEKRRRNLDWTLAALLEKVDDGRVASAPAKRASEVAEFARAARDVAIARLCTRVTAYVTMLDENARAREEERRYWNAERRRRHKEGKAWDGFGPIETEEEGGDG